jgi:uncharacterized protein
MTLLLDTGPLVAAIDPSDKHHVRCAALLESPKAGFLTSVATGESQHVAITAVDLARTAELVRGYAGLPPGAVDAPVIAVAERLKLTDVATLDRRHFIVVRPQHAAALNLCSSQSVQRSRGPPPFGLSSRPRQPLGDPEPPFGAYRKRARAVWPPITKASCHKEASICTAPSSGLMRRVPSGFE